MLLEHPIAIKIGPNLCQDLKNGIQCFVSKIPTITKTKPCPKSPNIIPNKSVKKNATNGVGSMVP